MVVFLGVSRYCERMRTVIGYMLTWTTYGTWLQGDRRGYVKDGEVLEGDPVLEAVNRESMGGGAVRFGAREKAVVREAIIRAASMLGQRVYAVAVCSNHVHLVVGSTTTKVGEAARLYKSAGTKAVRKLGREGRIWTKGYDKRFCYNEVDLAARVEYVDGHGEG